jgi:hypothetical protein
MSYAARLIKYAIRVRFPIGLSTQILDLIYDDDRHYTTSHSQLWSCYNCTLWGVLAPRPTNGTIMYWKGHGKGWRETDITYCCPACRDEHEAWVRENETGEGDTEDEKERSDSEDDDEGPDSKDGAEPVPAVC